MRLGELVKFTRLLNRVLAPGAVGEPRTISAKHLDNNFVTCYPKPLRGQGGEPYKIRYEERGWTMEPTMEFDVCENGEPAKYRFVAQRQSG